MDPQKALELFGFMALVSELDDEEEIEYDSDGRITSLPDGWAIEYLVSIEGYSGGDWLSFSEVAYSTEVRDEESILEAVDAPPVYFGGQGELVEASIDEAPIRIADIPKKARFV